MQEGERQRRMGKTKMGKVRRDARKDVKGWELEARDDKGENIIEAWRKGVERNEKNKRRKIAKFNI